MFRAFLLIVLIALVQTPVMANTGVYDVPSLMPFCDGSDAGELTQHNPVIS